MTTTRRSPPPPPPSTLVSLTVVVAPTLPVTARLTGHRRASTRRGPTAPRAPGAEAGTPGAGAGTRRLETLPYLLVFTPHLTSACATKRDTLRTRFLASLHRRVPNRHPIIRDSTSSVAVLTNRHKWASAERVSPSETMVTTAAVTTGQARARTMTNTSIICSAMDLVCILMTS